MSEQIAIRVEGVLYGEAEIVKLVVGLNLAKVETQRLKQEALTRETAYGISLRSLRTQVHVNQQAAEDCQKLKECLETMLEGFVDRKIEASRGRDY